MLVCTLRLAAQYLTSPGSAPCRCVCVAAVLQHHDWRRHETLVSSDAVPDACPRVLINRERVGEGMGGMRMLGSLLGFGGGGGFVFEGSEGAYRDVLHLGDTDDGVKELAKMLGWEAELESLITAGGIGGGEGKAEAAASSSSSSSSNQPSGSRQDSSSAATGHDAVQGAAAPTASAGDEAEQQLPTASHTAAASGDESVSTESSGPQSKV